jgi:hypothetical protein
MPERNMRRPIVTMSSNMKIFISLFVGFMIYSENIYKSEDESQLPFGHLFIGGQKWQIAIGIS